MKVIEFIGPDGRNYRIVPNPWKKFPAHRDEGRYRLYCGGCGICPSNDSIAELKKFAADYVARSLRGQLLEVQTRLCAVSLGLSRIAQPNWMEEAIRKFRWSNEIGQSRSKKSRQKRAR